MIRITRDGRLFMDMTAVAGLPQSEEEETHGSLAYSADGSDRRFDRRVFDEKWLSLVYRHSDRDRRCGLGGWLSSLLFGVDLTSGFNLTSLVVAVIGAVIVIAIVRLIFRGRSAL